MPETLPSVEAASSSASKSQLRYAWYVVAALTAVYTLGFVDRQVVSLLVAPIKRDLGVSDTQIGLLQGFAFALFYTFMGLPMGRIADQRNRRNLIAGGILVWSAFTSGCAATKSFLSLFLARMGVGVGEATLSPSAYSMIADYFPAERLGVALSVYYMGVFLGSGVALLAGGMTVDALTRTPILTLPVLGAIASWRATFLIVGLPGVLFALLCLTIREPLRKGMLRGPAGDSRPLNLVQSLREMRARWGSLVGLSLGMVFQSAATFALLAWAPTFFQRVYGWTPGRAGRALALILLTFGCFGMYFGGVLSDRWSRQGRIEAPLKVSVLAAIGPVLLLPLAMVAGRPSWTLALMGVGLFFLAFPMGIAVAALQRILPNQLRGQVSALYLFVLNLGGQTLGPLMPGLLNDRWFHDGKRLGDSMALTISCSGVLMLATFRATYAAYRRHFADQRSTEKIRSAPLKLSADIQ